MRRGLLTLALLAVALAAVAAGCGGGDADVPSGAVAVVDGTEIPRAELDELMAQAKKSYESAKQEFPKVGTPQHQSIQQQYVAFLVQKAEFEKEAEDLGIEISDEDIAKARTEFVKSRFGGDAKKLEEALKQQGVSEDTFRDTLYVSVLSQKIFDAVTKDVQVTDQEALASYTANQEQYRSPASREVRHILLAETAEGGQVDFEKSKAAAQRVYQQLKGGADFAALAKQVSDDPGTKNDGGKYLANKGQSAAEFDKVAFELETNEISQPVRTQFGYHVIQAIADAKPERVTPFKDVKDSLKASLLQQKRNETMTKWVEDLQKEYEGKVSYAAGFAPPNLPDRETQTETE